MAQKIKNFWLKFGAMFLTLYFMPLADFVMGFLGLRVSGAASAGTLECARERMDCPGTPSKSMNDNEYVLCTCADGVSVQEVYCFIRSDNLGDDVGAFNAYPCYNPNACTNGATRDCSTSSRYGTSTCRNNVWSACAYGACKSGYVMVSNTCLATCTIDNGSGYTMDISESSSTTGA